MKSIATSISIALLLLSLSFSFFALPCLADYASISVVVRDDLGPVGGATVAYILNGGTVSASTDAQGIASFSIPPGKYTFNVFKEGYQGTSVGVEAGVDSLVNVKLDRMYSISGTVIDASTEGPLKGASVTITNKENQNYYTGVTDDHGVFSIKVPNGYYSITVRAPFYSPGFMDDRGAGYHINKNPLYVGYIPLAASGSSLGDVQGVKVTCDYPGKKVKVNETITFDLTVANNGILDKTFLLAVKEAPDWPVKFVMGNDEISRVFVEKGGSKPVQVKITPLDAGEYPITIMAASGNDNSSVQLFVESSRDLEGRIELYVPGNITLNSGTSRDIEVTVRNNGSTRLTNVRLDIGDDDIPGSLTATVQTRDVGELAPGESKRFVVQVYAKADASESTDNLYMKAVSNEVRSEEKYLEVSVLKSGTWVGVGIAIAIVAILAFGFIVWKYGRR